MNEATIKAMDTNTEKKRPKKESLAPFDAILRKLLGTPPRPKKSAKPASKTR